MNRKFKFFPLVVVLALSAAIAHADTYCSAVSAQVTESFTDLNHELSSDSRAELSILSRCSKNHKICIAVQAPAPKWFGVVEGNSSDDISGASIRKLNAVSALTSSQLSNGRGRCVLTRFSGGTALVWMIEAWEIADGKVRPLKTDQIQLHGETKSPLELYRESESAMRKLR